MSLCVAAASTPPVCFVAIVANDEHPVTAHDIAAATEQLSLPEHIRDAIDQRAVSSLTRGNEYARWRAASATNEHAPGEARRRDLGANRPIDDGLQL
jgi:hypothetical protein